MDGKGEEGVTIGKEIGGECGGSNVGGSDVLLSASSDCFVRIWQRATASHYHF